jgi:hypothetical protein
MRFLAILLIAFLAAPAVAQETVEVPVESTPAAAPTGKVWVDDFAVYSSQHSNQQLVLGESSVGCVTPAEAHNAAIRSAAAELLPRVLARLKGPAPTAQQSQMMLQRVAAELQGNRAVVDRFTQKIERAYGTLWREWVLVDASPANVESLVRAVSADLRQQQNLTRLTAIVAGAILVVILVLYVLLDWLTKGYFSWRLRVAAVLLIALVAAGAAFNLRRQSVQWGPASHAPAVR